MYMNYLGVGGVGWPMAIPALLILLLVWNLFWKGFALWHSAKRHETWWFIAMLVINTAGILEIIYIFFIAKVPEFRSKIGLK